MIETYIGTLIVVVIAEFSALWYRMGKIEGELKRLNGQIHGKEK